MSWRKRELILKWYKERKQLKVKLAKKTNRSERLQENKTIKENSVWEEKRHHRRGQRAQRSSKNWRNPKWRHAQKEIRTKLFKIESNQMRERKKRIDKRLEGKQTRNQKRFRQRFVWSKLAENRKIWNKISKKWKIWSKNLLTIRKEFVKILENLKKRKRISRWKES